MYPLRNAIKAARKVRGSRRHLVSEEGPHFEDVVSKLLWDSVGFLKRYLAGVHFTLKMSKFNGPGTF